MHRPLAAVSEIEDADKTLAISKKYGKFILDDNTGVRTRLGREDGTYYMDQCLFLGGRHKGW